MTAEKKRPGLGAGVLLTVFLAHIGLLALLATQTLEIASSAQAQTGSGALRVHLLASQPVVPSVAPPPRPLPKPEKKILASAAPSSRVVEAPKPKPEGVSTPQPVAPSTPSLVAAAPPPVASGVTGQGPAATTGKPNAQDPGPAREVAQIDCRVPKPEYPRSSRRRGEAGTVSIRLTLDEQGQVSAVLDHSSGFPGLDASALQAALAAQCKPYVEAGRPIRVSALQSIQFVPTD